MNYRLHSSALLATATRGAVLAVTEPVDGTLNGEVVTFQPNVDYKSNGTTNLFTFDSAVDVLYQGNVIFAEPFSWTPDPILYQLADKNASDNPSQDDWDWTGGLGDGSASGFGNRATFYTEVGENGSHVAGVRPEWVGYVFGGSVNDSTITVAPGAPINDGLPGSESGVRSSTFGVYYSGTPAEIEANFGYPATFIRIA